MKNILILSFLVAVWIDLKAQDAYFQDSVESAKTLVRLFDICKQAHPESKDVNYATAAPSIALQIRSKEKKRKIADYSKLEERQQVDLLCTGIAQPLQNYKDYQIEKFTVESGYAGTWYFLDVLFNNAGTGRKARFGFLKINGKYALGDID